MKLIADAGSTKTDWFVSDDNSLHLQVKSSGINAMLMSEEAIEQVITHELLHSLTDVEISSIHFYGAGCLPGEPSEKVARLLKRHIGCQEIEVASDMLCAARALCGHNRGIACIIGTGSNSCLFDGTAIVDNVSPLGYILGDEGSGAVLGRTLLGNILKRQLPKHVSDDFANCYGLTARDIIERVYRQPEANKFLASFAPFIAKHINEPAIEGMVVDAFRSFLVKNVKNYDGWQHLPVNFTGSIAYNFSHCLQRACDAEGCNLASIQRSPAEGIVNYHRAAKSNIPI